MMHSPVMLSSEKRIVLFVTGKPNHDILSGKGNTGMSSEISIPILEIEIISWLYPMSIRHFSMNSLTRRSVNSGKYISLWRDTSGKRTIFPVLVRHSRIAVSNTIISTSSQGNSKGNFSERCLNSRDFPSEKNSLSHKYADPHTITSLISRSRSALIRYRENTHDELYTLSKIWWCSTEYRLCHVSTLAPRSIEWVSSPYSLYRWSPEYPDSLWIRDCSTSWVKGWGSHIFRANVTIPPEIYGESYGDHDHFEWVHPLFEKIWWKNFSHWRSGIYA